MSKEKEYNIGKDPCIEDLLSEHSVWWEILKGKPLNHHKYVGNPYMRRVRGKRHPLVMFKRADYENNLPE